jgi:hypothetical protein
MENAPAVPLPASFTFTVAEYSPFSKTGVSTTVAPFHPLEPIRVLLLVRVTSSLLSTTVITFFVPLGLSLIALRWLFSSYVRYPLSSPSTFQLQVMSSPKLIVVART